MSSVSAIAAGSLAATGRLDALVREANSAAQEAARAGAEPAVPPAFHIPRIDAFNDKPAVPASLDIKNIRRANAYADAFGMPVDPTKDIAAEGAASLFARYDKQVSNVLERIIRAKFKVLLDMKV
jgi:hypothetical protein